MKFATASAGGLRSASSTARHPKRHGNAISKQERKLEKKTHKEITLSKAVHSGKAESLRLKRLTTLLERQEASGDRSAAAATATAAADVQLTLLQHEAAAKLLFRALELCPPDDSKARTRLAPLLLRLGRAEEAHALLTHWAADHSLVLELARLLLALEVAPSELKVQVFKSAFVANWHAVVLLAASDTGAGLGLAAASDERAPEGGIEEALLALPSFRGWPSWPGLQGGNAWLAAAVLSEPPRTNTNGLAGDGRKAVEQFKAAFMPAFEELQRLAVESA
ncbi:hypothetical protein AB1Y20_007975 [Prymnesium parvum]|mmetsp:Transcript_17054/g.35978  ORF Transcript_17054/g.35978 Transcript_17054/m.35978 type:complete len:280 (+) Transcript_17054:37-876(+)